MTATRTLSARGTRRTRVAAAVALAVALSMAAAAARTSGSTLAGNSWSRRMVTVTVETDGNSWSLL